MPRCVPSGGRRCARSATSRSLRRRTANSRRPCPQPRPSRQPTRPPAAPEARLPARALGSLRGEPSLVYQAGTYTQPSGAFRPEPYAPGLQLCVPSLQPLCSQAAALCTQPATMCTQPATMCTQPATVCTQPATLRAPGGARARHGAELVARRPSLGRVRRRCLVGRAPRAALRTVPGDTGLQPSAHDRAAASCVGLQPLM